MQSENFNSSSITCFEQEHSNNSNCLQNLSMAPLIRCVKFLYLTFMGYSQLSQMVQKGNDVSVPFTEIVNITSALSRERFADINHEDIELLLYLHEEREFK